MVRSCISGIHSVASRKKAELKRWLERRWWSSICLLFGQCGLSEKCTELLTLLPSSTVQDVRTKAQRAFGKNHLKLVTAKNRVLLDHHKTLEEAEIEDGECLTALVLQPQLMATHRAFALLCPGDSKVVTWGDSAHGGDSSEVRHQLKGVKQIQATGLAFAAILEKGSVVMCSRFRLHLRPLWRFWQMDPSWPGVMETLAVTVRQFEISSRACSRFKPLILPLLPFLKMDPS